MAPLKIKHIVSFTSQDPKYCVKNLCSEGEAPKPWLCSPHDHSGLLKAELQMERAVIIGYIDVGNYGSAFIQIDVGRSSWSLEEPFVTLLPTATLMSPADSRQGAGRTGVRMFKKVDFMSAAAECPWDRVRITCTQPFNRRTQFGLSFLRIRSPQDEPEGGVEEQVESTICQKTPEQMTLKVKEWLSSPGVQRTFFGRMSGESPPETGSEDALLRGPCGAKAGLSRTARLVAVAKSTRRLFPQSPVAQKIRGSITDGEACASHNASGKQTGKHLKRKPKPARLTCADSTSSSKRTKPVASQVSRPNHSSPSRTPPSSQSGCLDSGDPETTCPICGEYFTSEYLPLHASSCEGEAEWSVPERTMETDFSRPHSSTPGPNIRSSTSPTDDLVSCPLCSCRFPLSQIQQHASNCEGPEDSDLIWAD